MLPHARAEGDTSLSDIFSLGSAIAGQLIYPFFVQRVAFGLVRRAEEIAEFGAWLGMKVNIILEKGAF